VRTLLHELRKFDRRRTLWAFASLVAFITILLSIYASTAHRQWRTAKDNLALARAPAYDVCAALELPLGPECLELRRLELSEAHQFIESTESRFRLAEAQQDPLGVGGVVAGFMASLPGAIVMAGLAGAFVGGEWSSRTIAGVLARDPRRMRFVLVKFLSQWCLGIALMLAAWALLAALGPFLRALYQVPPGPPSFDIGAFTLEHLLRAIVVIGVYASVGTLAAVIARNPLGTFGFSFGFVVAALIFGGIPATYPLSLGYWVGVWMGYHRVDMLADHVWIDRYPTLDLSLVRPAIGLVVFAVLLLIVAAASMRRAEVYA
jgi:hypothetical protein